MASGKKFAVVYFQNEDCYSEVPVLWLTSDQKQCWWPNCLKPKSRMVRGDIPNDDEAWVLYDVRFETYASTLESARKKAEEPGYVTGNDNSLGPRQRKNKNYDSSSSSSDNLTPPPSPKDKLKPTRTGKKASANTIQKIKDKINDKSCSPETHEVFSAGVITKVNEKGSSSESSLSLGAGFPLVEPQPKKSSAILVDATESNSSIMMAASLKTNYEDIPIVICKEDPAIEDVYFELRQLQVSMKTEMKTMHKYLISIDKRLKSITLESGNMEVNKDLENILAMLPCKTIEDIKKFDQTLEIEDKKETFIHYIKRIGGKDIKDNVNRCLPNMFTNELGTHCSYVGFRGNFKLQNFNFVKLFVEIMVLQNKCTNHEVEKCVAEWFRLSKQRKRRDIQK